MANVSEGDQSGSREVGGRGLVWAGERGSLRRPESEQVDTGFRGTDNGPDW